MVNYQIVIEAESEDHAELIGRKLYNQDDMPHIEDVSAHLVTGS